MESLLKRIAQLRVFIIGDVMLDHYIWGETSRISPEAPVPVINIECDTYSAGGAANVALNVASLGAKATIAGLFGRDDAGTRLRNILTQKGIETITATGIHATIMKTRVVVHRQQICRLDRESSHHDYEVGLKQMGEAFEKAVKNSDAIIFFDYAKGLLNDALVNKVTDFAHAQGKIIAIDPKPHSKIKFFEPDLITPNRNEALQLAGLEAKPHQPFPSAEVCARIYEQYRPRNLVVTMSEEGMLLSHHGKAGKTISTMAREVFDVSGAGDTAVAALTLGLAAGAAIEEAAQFANVASGVVLSKLGTSTVTPEEVLSHIPNEK